MDQMQKKPIVLITGVTGNLGRSIADDLSDGYQVIGLGRSIRESKFPIFKVDLSSDNSVATALSSIKEKFGTTIASVIHLVSYFDFSGDDNPLYEAVNVEGTLRLLRGLQDFNVEQFVYASTMLVHKPCRPGERIDEKQLIEPRWAYPASKARAEEVIRKEHGGIPYVILRIAGVYDERWLVPTLAHQIARIYERDFQSYFYSGSTLVGQSMVHRQDLLDCVHLTVQQRKVLPVECELLIGEADAMGYDALQDELGLLIHGVEDWPTLSLPKSIAAFGSWAQGKLEPVVPDVIDGGKAPFIRPFMVELADDHYALDTRRARDLLGWEPKHRLRDVLHEIVLTLKNDPSRWYEDNGLATPAWVRDATLAGENANDLRTRYEAQFQWEHAQNRWAHFTNIGLGSWLATQPILIGVAEPSLRAAEFWLGVALIVFAALAVSVRMQWARWVCAAIGTLVMAAPFLFWTTSAAAYLSDTLVGALVFALAVCLKPEPGPSAAAAMTGPLVPPGWSYNPSAWPQRLPIILMALTGVYISRYLAAYQLGHITSVWEPFFQGSASDPRNGTEEIIMSSVAKAWPVSDAAVGGFTYLLEILTGVIGSHARWRTMPWLVILFGLMIAPLGVTSIFFIIIQPIVIGTWSTIALFGALMILIQIPYSLDELIATLQFMRRRHRAGQNWLRVLFFGDTDVNDAEHNTSGLRQRDDEFDASAWTVLKNIVGGGVNLPWNLAIAALIGAMLMCSPFFIDESGLIDAHHIIGSLVLATVSISAAEVVRRFRYVVGLLGACTVIAPFYYGASMAALVYSQVAGIALIVLCIRRGRVSESYGSWIGMTK